MLVDPDGLAAAAARLRDALTAVTGDPVHPPLGADPTSTGAAERLSTAATALAAGLAAHLTALTGTADGLGLVSAGYEATDRANAHRIASLGRDGGAGPTPTGVAPPAPPLPPDVRAPLPPVPATSGQAISTAVHAGDPAAGESFSASWSRLASAAQEAAETVRSVIGQLPEALDSPHAAPAISTHLTAFATGFERAGRRASSLARQAEDYAALRHQAGQAIPTPQRFAEAQDRWQRIAQANARSGGRYAVPLARAQAELTELNTQAVTSYTEYTAGADAATGQGGGPSQPGEDTHDAEDGPAKDTDHPGSTGPGEDPVADPASTGAGEPDGTAATGAASPEAASPEAMGQLAGMIPTVLGAAGGLLGGLTKAPEAVLQGGMQAVQAATQGLSGLASAKPDTAPVAGSDVGPLADGLGDTGGAGGGGGEVTPMGGGPPMPPGTVTPSTGPPPTPPAVPTGGGLPPPVAPGSGAGGGGMPMGMPMGGPAGGGRAEEPRGKKIVVPALPHTEAVTGKVSTDRMATAAAATTRDDPPTDDPPHHPGSPTVRRITMPRQDDAP